MVAIKTQRSFPTSQEENVRIGAVTYTTAQAMLKTNSFSNNSIQNATQLSKVNNHNLRKYDN